MKYFIIAGERSGDLHGSNLIKAIQKADNQSVINAWGGEMMAEAGAKILKNYRELAFMGFVEVIKNLPKILGFLRECKAQITEFQPDCVILIDYAGFNMRIAKWIKLTDFAFRRPKVFYYISPKVWAWNQKRALKIKRFIDKMFVIFPFEVEFFKKFDYEVEFVGNPLFDAIENFKIEKDFLKNNDLESKKIIALLPGSRRQEVEKFLHKMVAVSSELPESTDGKRSYHYVIAAVSNLPKSLYETFLRENVSMVTDSAYDLLSHSFAAIVASGTATLETALFGVPQVVVYEVNPITEKIVRWIIKVPYISLVNLIAQKAVVKELIQYEFNIKNLVIELKKITENSLVRERQLHDYQNIRQSLGGVGASEKAGRRIVELLKEMK